MHTLFLTRATTVYDTHVFNGGSNAIDDTLSRSSKLRHRQISHTELQMTQKQIEPCGHDAHISHKLFATQTGVAKVYTTPCGGLSGMSGGTTTTVAPLSENANRCQTSYVLCCLDTQPTGDLHVYGTRFTDSSSGKGTLSRLPYEGHAPPCGFTEFVRCLLSAGLRHPQHS